MDDKPWIEKYRPNSFNDIVLSDVNKKIINYIIENDYYPNMLFYGPPGTGKTTTILCLINEYQKKHNSNQNYIHLNASHERGIEVIRNQIEHFTKTNTFFSKDHKFVLLDEMDSLTKQAQILLQRVIKNSSNNNVSFILICNYLNKILPCIKDSFFTLYFNQTSKCCDDFINKCLKHENKIIDQKYINNIKNQYTHDLRSILNSLQNYDKNEIILSKETFDSLILNKNNKSLYKKIISIYDPHTFMCSFVMYLYEHHTLSNEILMTIKKILISDYEDNNFIKIFNSLLNKIKN